jgi:predicted dehydrogenase
MSFFSRRDFLKQSAGLAGALAAASLPRGVAAQDAPASAPSGDRLNVAVIGVNGRGKDHIRGFAGRHNCVVSHICDVDTRVTAQAVRQAEQGNRRINDGGPMPPAPRVVQDLRRLLDDRSIHIVSIATPNHWHALAAIWAMQAGKDVYVEKPVSHNVSEGRRIVEAARRYNRMCQAGTQIRSSTGSRAAIEFLRSGRLGQVRVARGLCYKRRDNPMGTVASVNQVPTPAGLDFNLWLGPAPQQPYHENLVHYRWHWYWDFGNGDLGNQGIHQMDVARWGLGTSELPRSVISLGGRFGVNDLGQTANTQLCVFHYPSAELIFEVRGLQTEPFHGARVGNIFHCTDGMLVFTSYTSAVAYDNQGNVIQRFNGPDDHYGNFVRAVRSRRREDLNGEILEGHLSSALCHLANISYRLGSPQPFNPRTRMIGDDPQATETLGRMEEHLRANAVPLDQTRLQVGRRLTVDSEHERFVNDEEANRYLTREYRQGFEVPARQTPLTPDPAAVSSPAHGCSPRKAPGSESCGHGSGSRAAG